MNYILSFKAFVVITIYVSPRKEGEFKTICLCCQFDIIFGCIIYQANKNS